MLTLRQLDDLPDSIVDIITATEREIINDMARRIAKMGAITDTAQWQLYRLEALGAERDYIMHRLNRALNMSEHELIRLFDEAATRSLAIDDAIYRAAGYNPQPLADNAYMQQLIRAGLIKTLTEYRNLTLTTAATAAQQFENTLDLAYHKVTSGGFTYQQAIRDGIRSLTMKGIASIRYPTGWVDYLDVAFRRATLTGVNQTAAELQLRRMDEMGVDLIETTAHHGARTAPGPGPDNHAWWQGRWFSRSRRPSKYPDFYEQTGYGTGPGLCGWNCRHSFFPVIEGLSDRAYSLDQLRQLNARTVTLDGKKMSLYDATQQQRCIERKIRRWKREESAMSAAGLDSSTAKTKVREWQAAQRDFIDQTGLTRDYFRERAVAQYGVKYSNADIAKTLSGKAFRVGNPGKPSKTKAPDAVLQNAFSDGTISIPQGAGITDVRVIAGQTTHTPLRDTPRLNLDHPNTDPTLWQKKVGTASVDGSPVYLHWYENDGVMYEEKVKP